MAALGALCAFLGGRPAFAQDEEPVTGPIDILITQDLGEDEYEDCSAEQEAAIISGEIIVCRRRRDNREFGYDEDRALQRYAEETMNRGDPRAPDFAESCKKNPEKGPCIGFGRVPPPAYIVDFSELPDTPPGSDADRIGQGLAPRGNTAEAPVPPRQIELGLPPLPGVEASEEVSPLEEASPEEEPSG
ncbi:hypothetical protein [Qipengyuania flava]|uniref:hypothetical protein n=1 Tax=Qipengyuania flava TaxID=192812 RepID=UPI001C62F52D|nr:hypothetical protein [Qipengyuania flava]QYJ07195.1 hypothetical protein KUV82_00235 [Qipengyuania flava]